MYGNLGPMCPARLGEGSESPKPVPVFVRYYRQVFSQTGASVPMKREYLTLAMMLDSLLEGGILKSIDVAVQRLKAVKQISQGVPAQVANRLELIPPEMATLASTEEARMAAQEHKREEKVRSTWTPKGTWENAWNRGQWEDHTLEGEKGFKRKMGRKSASPERVSSSSERSGSGQGVTGCSSVTLVPDASPPA